jgi:hypothetical protein
MLGVESARRLGIQNGEVMEWLKESWAYVLLGAGCLAATGKK